MALSVNKRVIKDIHEGSISLKNEHGIYISPEDKNMYNIHFLLPGPEDTPFYGGLYHGMIRLNYNHPLGPPNIFMITPSGRFDVEKYPISTGSRGICTSFTAFHPETWTPVCNIELVLKGFISFMCDFEDGGQGTFTSNLNIIKKMAVESLEHIKKDKLIAELFPEIHNQVINKIYQPVNIGNLNRNCNKLKKINKNNKIQKKKKNKKKKKKIIYIDSDEELEREKINNNNIINFIDDFSPEKNIVKKKVTKINPNSSEEENIKRVITINPNSSEEENIKRVIKINPNSSEEENIKRVIKRDSDKKKVDTKVKKVDTKVDKNMIKN